MTFEELYRFIEPIGETVDDIKESKNFRSMVRGKSSTGSLFEHFQVLPESVCTCCPIHKPS